MVDVETLVKKTQSIYFLEEKERPLVAFNSRAGDHKKNAKNTPWHELY